MLGNMALQSPNPPAIVIATGNTTLGYNLSGATPNTYPADLIAVSAASAATIVLPLVGLTSTALAIGGSQLIRVMNLNTQAVALAGAGSDTILGSSATIAANATAVLISDPNNARWFRISG